MSAPERVLHCWTDRAQCVEKAHGFHSPEHVRAAYCEPSATCMLARGHEGPHEWTNDDQIGVSFAPDGGAA